MPPAQASFDRPAVDLTAEERLIGRVLGADWTAGAMRTWPEMTVEGLDWQRLLALAERHMVRPMLAAALREAGWRGAALAMRASLEAAERAAVTNSMCQLALLTDILARAKVQGIRVLAHKGVTLSAHLYGNPFLRDAVDLDLLVHPADLQRMDALLEALGCEADGSGHPPLSPRQQAILDQFRNERVFHHRATGVMVERHWTLDSNRHRVATDFDALWAARGTVMVADREIPVLGSRTLLHHVAMHAARHGWHRWKWLGDLIGLLRRAGDDVANIRAAVGSPVFDSWLLLAATIAGPAAIPPGIEPIARGRTTRALTRQALRIGRLPYVGGNPPRFSRRALRALYAYRLRLPGGFTGATLELRQFFHHAPDWQALRLPDLLIPLYYLVRPFSFAWRQIAALAGEIIAARGPARRNSE